jgi:amino acid transporter
MGILLLGVKESSTFNKIITFVNIGLILFIILLGAFHITPSNWTAPLQPDTKVPEGSFLLMFIMILCSTDRAKRKFLIEQIHVQAALLMADGLLVV